MTKPELQRLARIMSPDAAIVWSMRREYSRVVAMMRAARDSQRRSKLLKRAALIRKSIRDAETILRASAEEAYDSPAVVVGGVDVEEFLVRR